jgi:hypothetical protein
MTTASRSLATALWGARFASGLLRPSYTTSWDTTMEENRDGKIILPAKRGGEGGRAVEVER